MFKQNLALNNLQRLICHKTPSNTKTKKIYRYIYAHTHTHTHTHISKVGERSQGRPEGFFFSSYYTEV